MTYAARAAARHVRIYTRAGENVRRGRDIVRSGVTLCHTEDSARAQRGDVLVRQGGREDRAAQHGEALEYNGMKNKMK